MMTNTKLINKVWAAFLSNLRNGDVIAANTVDIFRRAPYTAKSSNIWELVQFIPRSNVLSYPVSMVFKTTVDDAATKQVRLEPSAYMSNSVPLLQEMQQNTTMYSMLWAMAQQ
jgi:hypothetical protein